MRQVRFNIDTTFSENKRAAMGVKYLNSGEIPSRTGTELAISCLLTPLGYAVFGGSLQEVDSQIEISRTIFESYMNLARNRAESDEKSLAQENGDEIANAVLANETKVEAKAELVTADIAQSESEEEALTEINFDDEEF